MNNLKNFFENTVTIIEKLNLKKINITISKISKIKKKRGRIFFLGVGGSAANCSHAVNDFRKLCQIECYSPIDNVAELTARINDDGWESCFKEWLKICNLNKKDALFILSVGGGDIKKKVSVNLIKAIKYAKTKKCEIFGIIGRKNNYTVKSSNNIIQLGNIDKKLLTPISESLQSLVLHCMVSDKRLQKVKTKW
tara:strand:- start:138 stop:722 length:585 start_codon:yes stop_codon:yes gene_type:complete